MRIILPKAEDQRAERHAQSSVNRLGFRCRIVGQKFNSDIGIAHWNDTGLLHAQGSHVDLSLTETTGRVDAHILVCFLAYVLWKTLAQLSQRAGLGNEPRKVFEELAPITLVDVILPTRNGLIIRKRCVARPTVHQAILLQHLGLAIPSSLELAQV